MAAVSLKVGMDYGSDFAGLILGLLLIALPSNLLAISFYRRVRRPTQGET